MNVNGQEPGGGSFMLQPGQVLAAQVRLMLVYQGVAPRLVGDAQAMTRAITHGVRKAVGEFTGTLSSDWIAPGEIRFTIETVVGDRPPQPMPAPGPRLIT